MGQHDSLSALVIVGLGREAFHDLEVGVQIVTASQKRGSSFNSLFRAPRQVNRALLSSFGIWRIVFISVLLLLLTFGTFFYLHSRSQFLFDSCFTWGALAGNKWIPISIVGIIVLQLLFHLGKNSPRFGD